MNGSWLGVGVIDAIIGLMVVEGLALFVWRSITRTGPARASTLANLASGALLLVAMRTALDGAASATIAASLLAAFVAHLVDLSLRWRAASPACDAPSTAPLMPFLSGASVSRLPRDEASHG